MSILERKEFAPSLRRNLPSVMTRLVIIVSALAILISGAFSSPADANPLSSKKDPITAAKENVAKAQKDASAAATRYANAYGALQKLDDQLSDTQSRLDTTSSQIGDMQSKVSERAKDAYIRASDVEANSTFEDKVDEERREQFLDTVSEFDDAQLTQFVSMKEDLEITKNQLSVLKEDRKNQLKALDAEKKALNEKLAAATKAQKDLEAKAARDAKARAALAKSQRTSGGGGRSSIAPGTIINPGGGALTCPIQGSLAFSNDWGQPRSGGRTHKGNDLFSPRGTPNVAVVAGSVTFRNEGTGGLSAYLAGDNGITYYYTHLNSYVGSNRRVARGEVIGTTGSTGNASGGATHTHFEIRMGGANGTRVNPYATLRSIC